VEKDNESPPFTDKRAGRGEKSLRDGSGGLNGRDEEKRGEADY